MTRAEEDFFQLGTVATVKQVLKMPSDSIRILVEGEQRGRIMALHQEEPYLYGRIETIEDVAYDAQRPRVEALIRRARQLYSDFLELSQKPVRDQMILLMASDEPGFTARLRGAARQLFLPGKTARPGAASPCPAA